MSAWIESHQTLRDHPKTRKLARLLGVSRAAAIGHLHCLWWWALDYAEDGDLSRYDALDIALGAEWEDDPGVFIAALEAAGFLTAETTIHDWDDYTGRLIERREQAREASKERQRRYRERHKQPEPDTPVTPPTPLGDAPSRERNALRERNVTPRNAPTQHNTTEPNTTPPNTTPPRAPDGAPPAKPAGRKGVAKVVAIEPAVGEPALPHGREDGDVYALVDAYATAKGIAPKDVTGRHRQEAFRAFKDLPAWVKPVDVNACASYLLSDPFWAEPGKLTVAKLAETIPEWDARGRPTARAPRRGAPANGRLTANDLMTIAVEGARKHGTS